MTGRRNFLAGAVLPAAALAAACTTTPPADHAPAPAADDGQDLKDVPVPAVPPEDDPRAQISLNTYRAPHLGEPFGPNVKLFDQVVGAGTQHPTDQKSARHNLRQVLASQYPNDPLLAWSDVFAVSFDSQTADMVLAATKHLSSPDHSNQLFFEPQLYDTWLRSASGLLDRCLQYRREMATFEVQATSVLVDYLTYIRLYPTQRQLLDLSDATEIDRLESAGQSLSSKKYRESWREERMARGAAFETSYAALAAGRRANVQKNLFTVAVQQFEDSVALQLHKFSRFVSPGSSLNYAERYLRIKALLRDDLMSAYAKLYCAWIGIQGALPDFKNISISLESGVSRPVSVKSIPSTMPAFATPEAMRTWIKQFYPDSGQRSVDIIDGLVVWTRAVMRELERRGQFESEFTVSIPLWTLATSPVNGGVIAAGVNSPAHAVTFTLGKTESLVPCAIAKNARVVGCGLTYIHGLEDHIQPVNAGNQTAMLGRMNALVTPPEQQTVIRGSLPYQRPPVLLPNVHIQGGMSGDLEPTLSYDAGITGISSEGAWKITVAPNALVWYDTSGQSNPPKVSDMALGFILHLRIRASIG